MAPTTSSTNASVTHTVGCNYVKDFDIPRRALLDDDAEKLDIAASTVSERLRRAQTQLIQETVATTWPPLPN